MLFLRTKESKRTTAVEWTAEETTINLMKRGHLVNEYLKDGAETKVYLDYDEYNEEREWTPEEMAEKEAEVRGKVEELLQLFGKDCSPKPTYVLATRHGRKPNGWWKRSYRPYISGLRVKYTDIHRMIWEARQQGYWDDSVYKKSEQLLACVNGWKDNDDRRVLQPEPGTEDDILSYVAQHVDPSWQPIIFDDEDDATVDEKSGGVREVHEDDARYAEDLVLKCLDAGRAYEYQGWINVGMIMKWVGASYEAFEEFSKRSVKFISSADCRKKWNDLPPDGRLGMGTLCMLAKEDNPDAYDELKKEMNKRRVTKQDHPASLKCDAIINALRDKGGLLQHINPTNTMIDIESNGNKRVIAATSGLIKALVGPDFKVNALVNGGISADFGLLFDKFPMHSAYNTKAIHNLITMEHPICEFDQSGKSVSIRDASSRSNRIEVINIDPADNTAVLQVYVNDVNVRAISTRKTISGLLKAITDSQLNHASSCFGITQNVFNTINIINDPTDHDSRSLDELVTVLVQSDQAQDLLSRIRNCPTPPSTVPNIYYCDPVTNVWSNMNNTEVENMIVAKFDSLSITRRESRSIKSVRGRRDVLYLLAATVIDKTFVDRLDRSLDFFAVDNGIFDSSSGKVVFRPIRSEDMISRTAGWSYDPQMASDHRSEVDAFLASIFPVMEERQLAVKFFANLLSGHRHVKKFIVLTDRSGGHNGKTTLKELLKWFFGPFFNGAGRKFVAKATFEAGRNGHDAGMEALNGIRLMVAEEITRDVTLDDGVVKTVSGGQSSVEGRKIGIGSGFSFVWQAGVVLVFNEGDCPKYNAGDTALYDRMIVVPMRTKFVPVLSEDPSVSNEALKVHDINSKFPDMRSALADVFVELYENNDDVFHKDRIPSSMSEWKQEISEEANPFAEWLTENIAITGNTEDYISFAQLAKASKGVGVGGKNAKISIGYVQSFFASHKDTVKVWMNDTPIKVNGHSVRRPIIGIKFSDSINM